MVVCCVCVCVCVRVRVCVLTNIGEILLYTEWVSYSILSFGIIKKNRNLFILKFKKYCLKYSIKKNFT